ncbi:glycoside hydrolase family 28 protein [Gracilimonas sp.]|uniref:glycoside hydrolase family 28 protein n=1 Tax=Gracilimonas sp. TaxID=1974203 RepID=UPI0032EF5682
MKKRSLALLVLLTVFIGLAGYQGAQAQSDVWNAADKIVADITLPTFPDQTFTITDFGADSGDALPAIQNAIIKANYEGGGKVIIPKGTWLVKGPIHLKSNVNLHISDGAELVFSANPADYLPQVLTRWEGTEAYNLSPLIYAYQVHNVAITGSGILNGNAENGFATWRDKQSEAQNRLRKMGAEGTPVHKRVFGLNDYLRPSFIQFFSSSSILVEGITIKNSPMWVNHFIYSTQITLRNVTVKSYRLNNDGVVLDSSTKALIEGNSFSTGDDSIVIKSGRDQDGWRVAKTSEDIVIRNNYMEGHNALAVGSEMSGGVQYIYMENNELGKVASAIYFKSNLDRGGFIRNVYVKDTKVEAADILLRFHTNYHSHRGGNFPAEYEHFVIENVEAKKARVGIEILGIPEMPAKNITVINLNIADADKPQNIAHVEGLEFKNVSINGKLIKFPPN